MTGGQRFADALLRYRFVFLNLLSAALLGAYFHWIHPTFLEHIVAVYRTRQPDLALGGVLLCMYPLEIIGLLLKLPAFSERMNRNARPSSLGVGLGGFLLMGTLAVNGLPAILILPALNLDQNMNIAKLVPMLLLLAVIFLCLALPTAILGGVWNASSSRSSQPAASSLQAVPARPKFTWKGFARETSGDLLLTLYGVMALTATWDFMAAISPPDDHYSLGSMVVLFLIFVFFYASSRAVYSMEEVLTRQPWYLRLLSLGITGAAGILALMQL